MRMLEPQEGIDEILNTFPDTGSTSEQDIESIRTWLTGGTKLLKIYPIWDNFNFSNWHSFCNERFSHEIRRNSDTVRSLILK